MNNGQSLVPSTDMYFQSQRMDQMMNMATHFFNAKCFPASIKNPEQLFVLIQAGVEMGLAPMEAINSLYIVNGKITMYGMAMTKRVRERGWKITYEESDNSCTATVEKGEEKYTYTATKKDLEALSSKAASFSLRDKLKWHAISRIIRFYIPEVTNGVVSYIKEEMSTGEEFKKVEVKQDIAPEIMLNRLKLRLTGKTDEEKLAHFNKVNDSNYTNFDLPREEVVKTISSLM